mgnify:FL=1
MSKYDGRRNPSKKAVALQYEAGNSAPVIVASGMGYMAEKIVEVASDSGVPIYEDNSLATILTQLKLGQEIPEELYKAIVEIYVYFLHFDPNKPKESGKPVSGPAPEKGARAETKAEQEA